MNPLLSAWNLARQFFPPDFSPHYLGVETGPLAKTLTMAAGGILVSVIIGLLAGILVGAQLPGARIVYVSLASLRSIPDLTMAILCVVLVGIGPAAGMLALAIFYSAAMGKIFADLFRSADRDPIYALRATGAPRLVIAFFGFLPLRFKDSLSYAMYEFESAIRASVIVGAVGGGGIGTELVGSLNALDYHRATTLILMLIALIAAVDILAQVVKRNPKLLWGLFPLAAIALLSNRPAMFAFSHSLQTFAAMLPPELPRDAVAALPKLLGETLEIALFGTCLAVMGALPLGLCAARNLAPTFLSFPVRRCLESLRAVPEIVLGLLFVSAIGVGPKAGIAALALHGAGSLGRLYAESFENVKSMPVRAIAATGASKISIAAFAFVPLALAPLTVHTLFRLEWNIRAAAIVGIIGAGGIGQALFDAQQLFFYKQMLAYILITGLLVYAADSGSALLRRRMKLVEI